MNLPDQYAHALRQLVCEHPDRASEYLKNLHGALGRRGHIHLLPRIIRAYETLEAGERRRARSRQTTLGGRRTRLLLELYRTLIAS